MITLIMKTKHFEFVAFGDDLTNAKQIMNEGFMFHLKEYETVWEEDVEPTEYYGYSTTPVTNHSVYLNGNRIKGF